jgi:hypothetical protein
MFKDVVSLANAAARENIPEQDMRMRYRRSRKTQNPIGYEKGGKIWIRLVDGKVPEPMTSGGGPNLNVINNNNALPDNVMPPVPAEYRRSAESVPERDDPAPEPEQTPDEVRLEYQALELKRLKQELAEAKDQIREERRRYDQLQADWRTDREREQVLRQDLQRLMGQLDSRLSLAAPEADRMDKLEQDNRDLKTGVVSLVEYISKKRGQ